VPGREADVPLYEYQCGRCGRFEVIQKFSDAALTACPTCGEEVHKLPSAPAFHFKGTGWYVTDYARKSPGKEETAKKTEGAPAAAGDGAKADTKPDAKPASPESATPQTPVSKDSGGSPTK
jgi:putative FmdB family regulatory protein